MDIGFGAAIAGAWATPRNLAELAQRAERLGYRSLWTFQRLFVPADVDLAPVYRSVLDPMVSLGYLAAATSTVRLGVAVVNHPFQSPLLLAKQAATVDVLLSGSYEQIRADTGWLESCGVTEVFYDLNFDRLVGDPAQDEGTATARAAEILEALAPG